MNTPTQLPDVTVISRRPLLYRDADAARALGLPPYVQAASSAALVGGDLYVAQDDVHALARVSLADALAEPLPLPLPGALLRERHDKADFEACALLPGGKLLVMGSGARPERRVAIEVDLAGGPARVLPAVPFYEALAAQVVSLGGKLNLEGVAISKTVTHLLHRGPGAGGEPANVLVQLPTEAFLASLRQGQPPAALQARAIELGSRDGVALTWTDGVEVQGVGLVFTASAERTGDVVQDGPCVGSALGVLRPDGQVALAWLRQGEGLLEAKVEGLALAGERAWLVTDPDDPGRPAELIEVEFGQIFSAEGAPLVVGASVLGTAELNLPPMKISFARSRCECQAGLVAKLNEQRHVVQAYTVDSSGEQEPAPAHSIGAQRDRFDIGWLCGVCGRNVLRSFSADGLLWTEEAPPPAAEAKAG